MNFQHNYVPISCIVVDRQDGKGNAGRVKVKSVIDGKDSISDWLPIFASPNQSQGVTPPQPGTKVIAYALGNNMADRKLAFIVSSQIENSDRNISGTADPTNLDQYTTVKEEHISGSADGTNEMKENGRGSDWQKVPYKHANQKTLSTVAERFDIYNVFGNLNELMMTMPTVMNVATARTPFASIITSGMNGLLQGLPVGLSNLLDMLPLDELESKLPSNLMSGLKNSTSIASSFNPLDPEGFTFDKNRANPNTFASNAMQVLSNVSNFGELREGISKVLNDDSVKDLSSMPDIEVSAGSAFGTITGKLKADGTLEMEPDDIIMELINLFLSFLTGGGIPSLGGEDDFFNGSLIPEKLFERMYPETETKFKELLEHMANSQPRTKINSHMTTLRQRLENGKTGA